MKYLYDRQKGEPYDDYMERCYMLHLSDFREEKKARGEWIPQEEYEELTGRRGMKDDEL